MDRNEYDQLFYEDLRSARRRKRAVYEDRDKQLLRLYREKQALQDANHKIEWVPLAKPYQRGWERIFVLREDVKREPKAAFYQGILDKINTRQWSHRKDFKKKKRRHGKKVYKVREQSLSFVSESKFRSKDFTDAERQCFRSITRVHERYEFIEYYFLESWRFVLHTRPNMVTHVRVVNTEIESRLAYIRDIFEQRNYMDRVLVLCHGSSWNGHTPSSVDFKVKKYASIPDDDDDPSHAIGQALQNLPDQREVFLCLAA